MSSGLRQPAGRALQRLTLSMRTRFLASADVSSCVWMPGKAKESNALIGCMWPDVGRRWLPTNGSHEWTDTVADLPNKSANRQRVAAATTGITLSDEGSRRECARSRRYVRLRGQDKALKPARRSGCSVPLRDASGVDRPPRVRAGNPAAAISFALRSSGTLAWYV
jgi:hypothetical protein